MHVLFEWRGDFGNDELNALHAEGFGHTVVDDDWQGRLGRLSLGWVTARQCERLIGFVNMPWDGASHAFIIDALVAGGHRRKGIGTRMVEICAKEARAAGCAWLHVDFEDHLQEFYLGACGFRSTKGGVVSFESA